MARPLVAIVGRPNVGKSTIFNRLTGSRDAIVDDLSGVTRDRNFSQVEWNGKIFDIMDTGGYVPESSDLFETAIREQVSIGILESDLVLFVVDGRQGLSPVDKEIAEMIRKSGKEAILVVNKIDAENLKAMSADFYSLGFSRNYDISAQSGRRTGDLLDEVLAALKFPDEGEDEDKRLRIAIVGRPNVGKSSITNALLGRDRSIVTNIPGTTRDSINSVLKFYGEEIILVDTAGLRKRTKVESSIEFYSNVRTMRAISDSDVAVVMVDASQGLEKQDLKIIGEAETRRKGIVLCVNKWDLIEKDTKTAQKMTVLMKERLGRMDYIPIIFTSALEGKRIFKLIELAKRVAEERGKKIPTNELNEKILPVLQKTPPPSTAKGKEVKIKYLTQAGARYPIFLLFGNDSSSIPDNYKRFLEKIFRKEFGFEGVPFVISFKDK